MFWWWAGVEFLGENQWVWDLLSETRSSCDTKSTCHSCTCPSIPYSQLQAEKGTRILVRAGFVVRSPWLGRTLGWLQAPHNSQGVQGQALGLCYQIQFKAHLGYTCKSWMLQTCKPCSSILYIVIFYQPWWSKLWIFLLTASGSLKTWVRILILLKKTYLWMVPWCGR